MADRKVRWIGGYAVAAAVGAIVISPLLALSYFGTDDGAESLEPSTVRAWAGPTRDVLDGLLTWASPDRVYATYVQALAVLFPAVFLCARAVRARRSPAGRVERWGWRISFVGYGLASVALLACFVVLFARVTAEAALNPIYLALMFPGMFLSAIGSTVLGIGLLRSHYPARSTAWLLTLAFPAMLVIPTLLGHNSLGMLPLFVAWGIEGRRLMDQPDVSLTPMAAPPARVDHV